MSALTFGSLFAGIGGMDLGLERAGMTCRWQVEINPFCQRVLAKHWPGVVRHSDVREVGAHNLERVDVICGGFPCQDVSFAGLGVGLDGERSGLWREFHRLIRELRPRFVLVENVAALLARGLGRVLGDLAASGYDAEWDCIPAAAVGAPHRRDRLFLVAHAQGVGRGAGWALRSAGNGEGAPPARLPISDRDGERLAGSGLPEGEGWPALPDPDGSGTAVLRGPVRQSQWWATEPNVGRVVHGLPSRVVADHLRALGNAVVPAVAEFIGRRIQEVA